MAKTLTPIYNTSVLLGDGVTKQVTLTEKITQGRQVCVCLRLQSINRTYSPIFYVNAIPRNYSFAVDNDHICVITIYDSTRMDIIIHKSVGASAFTDLYLDYVYI